VKKLIATCVALTFAVGMAGFAVAQEKKADEKKTEMKSDMKMDKKEKKAAAKTASGTVKSASADSLVVGGKMKGKDEEWTFGLDSKTSVKRGGKSITPGDLKAGDAVRVRYTEEGGKMMAQSVTVSGGAKKMDKADKMDKMDKADKMESKPAEKK
jgi:Domain of unknown function (DUF5666)